MMAESPPAIKREHRFNLPDHHHHHHDDGMMLFPKEADDSSAFMSPSLKEATATAATTPDRNHHNSRTSPSSLDFPCDEYSHSDKPVLLVPGSKLSASVETKTTEQLTNVTEQSSSSERHQHHYHPSSPTRDAWDFEMELMTKSKVFSSVLVQPIPVWNDMEEAVVQYAPQWKPSQRSKLIELWIKFMELKVLVEDYATNEHELLLEPTQLVGRVWYAIAQHPDLYQEVTFWIQDFHHKEHTLIYRPPQTLHKQQQPQQQQQQRREEEDSSGRISSSGHHHTGGNNNNSDQAQLFLQQQQGSTRHSKLERAQRLFICYFQQAMPETLKAVSNMSKRKYGSSNGSNPEEEEEAEGQPKVVQENNIVPENASDEEDSQFDDDDSDSDDTDSDEEYTYDYYSGKDSRTAYTDFSAATQDNYYWIGTRFQSWLSCWEDPFHGSSNSTAATADILRMEEDMKKKKKNKKKKNQGDNYSRDFEEDELLQDDANDFWPCTTTDVTTLEKDEDEDDDLADNEIRRSSNIVQPGDSPIHDDDPVPDLNETDEQSSTLWVTFDTSKNDINQEDDEMTFLTMDTALHQQGAGTPEKRGKKAQFYSSPRRSRGGTAAAAANTTASTSANKKKSSQAPINNNNKAKNKLPSVAAQKSSKGNNKSSRKNNKKNKDKNKKEGSSWGFLPEDWSAIKTKFRIASMIIKEFE